MPYVSDNSDRRSPSLWLWLAASCALCSAMSMGAILGWSSPGLPSMEDPLSEPHLDNKKDEGKESWIGSSITLGALAGGLIAGPLFGFFGLKKCLIALGVPFVVGWLCIIFAKDVPLIIIGRVLTGFGAGISCGVAPTYANQISTPGVRGLLGTGFQIFVNLGILYIDIFGIWMSWRWLCIPALVPAGIMSIGMLFMPESPVWLMNKFGRSAQVVDALQRLRSSDSDIEGELKELQNRIEAQKSEATGFSLGQLRRPDVFKPLIIALSLMFFQQLSGVNAVLFYASAIFKSAGSKIDPNVNAVIVTGTMFAAVVVGGLIIDKLGRKILLLLSGSGHVISLTLMGYYFYQADKECPTITPNTTTTIGTDMTTIATTLIDYTTTMTSSTVAPECVPPLGWLPVVSLVMFVIMFSLGYGPIPWMITAEITPGYALSFVSSLATGVNWFFAFIVTLEFKNITAPEALNKHGAFWLFAGICAASVVFTALFIPESKGKTPEDMSRIFLGIQDNGRSDKHNENKISSTVSTI